MKTQLLCTFTKRNKLNEAVDIIVSCNDILYDKIYVFANNDDELYGNLELPIYRIIFCPNSLAFLCLHEWDGQKTQKYSDTS